MMGLSLQKSDLLNWAFQKKQKMARNKIIVPYI